MKRAEDRSLDRFHAVNDVAKCRQVREDSLRRLGNSANISETLVNIGSREVFWFLRAWTEWNCPWIIWFCPWTEGFRPFRIWFRPRTIWFRERIIWFCPSPIGNCPWIICFCPFTIRFCPSPIRNRPNNLSFRPSKTSLRPFTIAFRPPPNGNRPSRIFFRPWTEARTACNFRQIPLKHSVNRRTLPQNANRNSLPHCISLVENPPFP